MPAQSKAFVIQRQWQMLKLLPSHDMPGRTAGDLAVALATRGYDVTRRTVERDLEHLRAVMAWRYRGWRPPRQWRFT